MKNGKAKQIFAIVGILILVGLYVATLVTAIMAKPYAHQMFIASIFCSLVIPVIIYGFLLIGKAYGKKEKNGVSLHQLRRMKKEMSKLPDEEIESVEPTQEESIENDTQKKQ